MTGPLERLRKARPDELIPYDDVLAELRSHPELTEQKTVGTFHRGSRTCARFCISTPTAPRSSPT